MLQTLYYVLAGIFAALAAFIPSTGDAYNHSGRSPFFKKLTLRGYLTIASLGLALFFSFLKDSVASHEQDMKVVENNEILRQRDSTIRSLINANEENRAEDSRMSLATYTEVLAKYNLQYIEGQNKVVKIVRDSSSRPLNIPAFDLCKYPRCSSPIIFEPGEDARLAIKFDNTGSAAFNIDLKATFCIRYNDRFYVDSNLTGFFKKTLLNTEETTTAHVNIGQLDKRVDTVYFCFSGCYYNSDGKRFPIYSIHECSIKTKEYFGPVGDRDYDNITHMLKALKIID